MFDFVPNLIPFRSNTCRTQHTVYIVYSSSVSTQRACACRSRTCVPDVSRTRVCSRHAYKCPILAVFAGPGGMAGEGEGEAVLALGGGAATPPQAERGSPPMDEEEQSKIDSAVLPNVR